MAAAVLLSSCVKDTLYDTPHPDYGKIAVTADWSARGEGIDIPTTWTVTMGDYTGTETSATHAPNHLFAPGSYTLAVWNPAEGIMVNGTTATIAAATGNRAGTDAFVNNAPGWFFTYTKQVSIEKDKDYPLTAAMKQSAYIEKATVNNETMHVPERVVSFEPAINGFDVAAFLDGRLPGTDDDVLQSEIM